MRRDRSGLSGVVRVGVEGVCRGLRRVSVVVAVSLLGLACSGGEAGKDSSEGLVAKEPLVVVSYGGGAYQESHKRAFTEPFSLSQNVQVESVVWGAEYGKLQEMVSSGKVPWDVVEVTAAQFERGQRDGLFARIDMPIPAEAFQALPGGAQPTEYGVPNVFWSTVLAFRRDSTAPAPKSWADFWDFKAFPGPRGMYDDPRGNLEFALLADGVPLEKLYPLDVERAFRKLNAVKPEVRVWWSDGTEPVRLLLNRQVVMTSAWSGRIFASEQARSEIAYVWNGAAHELDYWTIPRGSRHVGMASQFILFASNPAPMARQAELTAYGPANALALSLVDPSVRGFLPSASENWKQSFVIEAAWWAENEPQMKARWLRWKNE